MRQNPDRMVVALGGNALLRHGDRGTAVEQEAHSLAARKGKKRAIVAVAHTILVSMYHMLKNKQPYRELGADFLDRRHADQGKRYLLKRLERLGVVVTIQSIESTTALST